MPVPVISVAQMREWEKVTWALGIKEDAVMRQAGQAVARLAEQLTRPGDFVLLLAGKGHNGDDAAYAHDFLRERRRELMRVVDPEIALAELPRQLTPKPALVVDGLFGIGLNRPLSGAWMKLIDALNESGCRVLAVDTPSGLSADTGLPLDVAVRAQVTISLGAAKQGLLKASAAPFVGRLEVAQAIGLSPYPFTTEVSFGTNSDYEGFPPWRSVLGHKGTFGHLALVAGSLGYHGAAVLAARGAQRAHPGLITLYTPEDVYLPTAAQLQSVMVRPFQAEPEVTTDCTAVVIGPGLASLAGAEAFKRFVRRLWRECPFPVLVDASALDWLPVDAGPMGGIRVLTPHPGEAARLLGITPNDVQRDRIQAARELSRRWGDCHVVLKGHHTVHLRGRNDALVNHSGNPHLAQGGSGDLLAGYLGGWLAQPELQPMSAQVLRYGVWQHGACADALLESKPGFTVEELANRLGDVRP
jgi:NAD(P)H-hydrate epimerase